MQQITFLLTISMLLISCGQTNSKEKELSLKEKELSLKEFQLDSIQKSKKETNTINSVNSVLQPSKNVAEKSKPTQNNSDRDKFIGTFTWFGQCPRGCFYTHIFNQNGTVKTTFETAESTETYSENWTVNEDSKILKIGKDKYFYKFNNDKIILSYKQYPKDIRELSRKK